MYKVIYLGWMVGCTGASERDVVLSEKVKTLKAAIEMCNLHTEKVTGHSPYVSNGVKFKSGGRGRNNVIVTGSILCYEIHKIK